MTSQFKNDEVLLTSWLSVIGLIVMQWSGVERAIDQCLHLLQQRSPIKNKKPTRLGSKLEIIARDMPSQAISPADFDSLRNRTKKTVRIRDILVHGMLISYDKTQMTLGKTTGISEVHAIEEFVIDGSVLDKSLQELIDISDQWSSIVFSLIEKQ